MTDLLSDVETPSDAELISRVRGGDVAAYGELFTRHEDAATRLARQLVRGPDADDLVSEAFAKVLSVLQGGGGPDVAFRAYLLTAVRRLHVDRIRAGQRLQTTDDLTPFDPGVPFQDTAVAGFESGAAAKAFASLPERWQLVLWHLEVEGQKPADIAPLLGMSANSVSALAYRAREGLRQAFLTMHIADIAGDRLPLGHTSTSARTSARASPSATPPRSRTTSTTAGAAPRCTSSSTEVNSNLAGIIAPLLLGAAAAGYLASSGGPGRPGRSCAGCPGQGLRGGQHRGRHRRRGRAGVTAAAAVAAVILSGGGPNNVVADPPGGRDDPPASPGTSAGTSPGTSPHLPRARPGVRRDPPTSASTAAATLPTTVAPSATVSAVPGPSTGTPTDLSLDAAGDPDRLTPWSQPRCLTLWFHRGARGGRRGLRDGGDQEPARRRRRGRQPRLGRDHALRPGHSTPPVAS